MLLTKILKNTLLNRAIVLHDDFFSIELLDLKRSSVMTCRGTTDEGCQPFAVKMDSGEGVAVCMRFLFGFSNPNKINFFLAQQRL